MEVYSALRVFIRTGAGAEASYQYDSRKACVVSSEQYMAECNPAVRQLMRKTIREVTARDEAQCKTDAEPPPPVAPPSGSAA
jgi:hypothetical protein